MKKKVLYVEDNIDTANAVKRILEHEGYEVHTANNGKEAFSIEEHNSFDLILLDMMLPDMSGWDIYEKFKKGEKKYKYAFLSAIPISNDRLEQLKNKGINEYIMKPFTKTDLINKINLILK